MTVIGVFVSGGMSIYKTAYNTIKDNGLDYYSIGLLLGSITPAVIGGFVLYWWLGKWIDRHKQFFLDKQSKQDEG